MTMRGKKHSLETRKLQRKRKIGTYVGDKNPMWGRRHSESAKSRISDYRKDACWVHRAGTCKSVPKSALSLFIREGWSRGRWPRGRRRWMTSPEGRTALVPVRLVPLREAEGWALGRRFT